MTAPTDLNIDHVARLARIALTDAEKTTFAQQLSDVLQNMEQLNKVDVSGVEATAHAFPVFNVWADDIAVSSMSLEKSLQNAPAQRDHMFSVPKVVE